MKRNLFMLWIGVGALLVTTQHLRADSRRTCGDRAIIVQNLAAAYGETLKSLGLARDNTVFELYASDDTGTWTLIVTQANGLSCLAGAGTAYMRNAAPSAPLDPAA